MVAFAKNRFVTPQEYLEYERKAVTKHEYHNGQIVAMAGASWAHNLITANSSRHIGNQLEEGPCVVVVTDLRVRVPACNKYYYPDGIVVCGEPAFEANGFDTLLNPRLIIEVLSDSTERADRIEKFDCYETLASLTDYVLISQHEPRVEHYARLSDGGWHYIVARGLEATLPLPSIGCELRLAAVYARVSFLPPAIELTSDSGANDPA